eukprot:GEMP01047864.1.p2 GENE.GEMP01047864.1~~GEMP01047864.1.p2  ORF type:complete len:113 (-),score=19.97 GEMP01047864.1:198-536(-)
MLARHEKMNETKYECTLLKKAPKNKCDICGPESARCPCQEGCFAGGCDNIESGAGNMLTRDGKKNVFCSPVVATLKNSAWEMLPRHGKNICPERVVVDAGASNFMTRQTVVQ